MVDHIDYSQYASWQFCPWAWYEKYLLKRRKRWPEGLRSDALAIGSLVHAGLENWYANNDGTIPQETIEKTTPTPEALGLCRRLVNGYIQTFPREAWELIRCERPLRFSLIEGKEGLAKIDLYFYVPEMMRVESGLAGYEITLKPGWWIQEYKTKSAATSTADFMQEWTTKMQADFQMLALSEYLENGFKEMPLHFPPPTNVNGLLVNVIEKPREYVPRRKCKQCGDYWNYSAWMPSVERAGHFLCPSCGNVQPLKPVESEKFQEPSYFRMVVERTPEQLVRSKQQISEIARDMRMMELSETSSEHRELYGAGPFELLQPNKEHCFDNSRRWGKECEFYKPHVYGISTIDNDQYEEAEDYLNEPRAIVE